MSQNTVGDIATSPNTKWFAQTGTGGTQVDQQDGLPGKSERVLEFVWYTSQLVGK